MKKAILFASFMLAVFSTQAIAGDARLFDLNEDQINAEFTELNELEVFVTENDGITLSQLRESNNALALNLNLSNNGIAGLMMLGEPPAGIPSFLWGCILGPIGILLVYLISEDSDETKKALFGCLAQGGLWVLWVLFWVLIFGNAFFFF